MQDTVPALHRIRMRIFLQEPGSMVLRRWKTGSCENFKIKFVNTKPMLVLNLVMIEGTFIAITISIDK